MERNRRRRLKKVIFGLALAVVLLLAATRGLYFFPTSVALGPCLPDWTSPSTYIGIFQPLASPMGKVRFRTGDVEVQICYGQPAARGRVVFRPDSSLALEKPVIVPDGRLWRMGANEPTRIFTSAPLVLGDLELDAGRYSIYTIPGPETWEVFVTRSTFHWGNQISNGVRAQEVGSFHANVMHSNSFQERLHIYAFPDGGNADQIVVAWTDREVYMPIRKR